MNLKALIKRVALGTAVIAMFGLAGCGNKTTTKTDATSTQASSTTAAKTPAAKAVDKANNQIMSGQYKEALKTLLAVKNPDEQTTNMIKDLQKYLAAENAYSDHQYSEATNNLNGVTSSSKPMRSAYISLKSKVKQAQQSSSSSTTTTQSAANSQAASETALDVIDKFAAQMNFNDPSYGIIPSGKDGDVYTFEVRQKNEDNSVAHLIGIYTYNATTGAVTKIG